jgi:DNA modification methylase
VAEPTYEVQVGDVRARLAEMADESVHAVVTSPPYWGLREYGTEPQWWGGDLGCAHSDAVVHPGRKLTGGTGKSTLGAGSGGNRISMEFQTKSQESQGFIGADTLTCSDCGAWCGELGQEPHPDKFVDNLVEVFEHVRRVLRSDGVCFLNMDDTYLANRTYQVPSTKAGEVSNGRGMVVPEGLKAKELALVPQRLAIALQRAGWYVRSEVVWDKPDAMPESVTDRPTRTHETILMLTKMGSYFWDQEAVKEPLRDGNDWALDGGWRMLRNMRGVWSVTTDNYSEAHFATMSKEVAERAIRASTSERGVCGDCGAPVVRQVERRSVERHELPREHPEYRPARYSTQNGGADPYEGQGQRFTFTRTVGWQRSCSCDRGFIPAMVLDPFGGAATTLLVARRLNRSSVGIELSPEFAEQARRRMATWWKDVTAPRASKSEGQLVLTDA